MTHQELFEQIKKKNSFLCIGLDTDSTKIPAHLLQKEDPVFEFNKQIIDATKDLCVCYKPNTAFYETLGAKGWLSLEKTINYINQTCKSIFTIADAKRGDIGNTSSMYAKAFLETLNFDAITVAPYMGEDSVSPFLEYKNKWVILLALTSNKGALDFQTSQLVSHDGGKEKKLFEQVLNTSKKWGTPLNMMYVVGATQAEMLVGIRKLVPDSFLLVPGVGAQGGSLQAVAKYGMNKTCGLLVNSSRGIIYAGNGEDFADKARAEAIVLQQEMKALLEEHSW
ncbi:MAG TPA: orotidine-5'-phosphate decarboxylase [Bacteroidia bacterium]|jgi:orotidine-5'-phosphate decarboxylase|nr:orotidine-5'-phosphate decarboxylase [Bacteroidia bacterium]